MITDTVADKLDQLVDTVASSLKELNLDVVTARPAEGKWSIKEIIGHLLDSATNNHHRFVRADGFSQLLFPGYAQVEWVSRQNYQEADWPLLLELWRTYNHQLAYVIRQISEDRLYTVCRIGDTEYVTLRFLVEDYVGHIEHHLEQIEGLSTF